jgi:hypothetical protein
MGPSGLKGRQWWLIAAGCGAVGILRPIANQHGHDSFALWILSLAALTATSVRFLVGEMRLIKWTWSKLK